MRTEIAWAELHSPIFLAGTNLSQKLDPKKRTGLKMEFDEEKRHLYVTYNEATARVPETSVLSMVELGTPTKGTPPPPTQPPPAFNPNAAQVETPTSHVHAGPGKGQTGRGGKGK